MGRYVFRESVKTFWFFSNMIAVSSSVLPFFPTGVYARTTEEAQESTYADHYGREIMENRKKVVQLEGKINDQQFLICEFESRSLRVKRNLEALAMTPGSQSDQKTQGVVTKMRAEYQTLMLQLDGVKRSVEGD